MYCIGSVVVRESRRMDVGSGATYFTLHEGGGYRRYGAMTLCAYLSELGRVQPMVLRLMRHGGGESKDEAWRLHFQRTSILGEFPKMSNRYRRRSALIAFGRKIKPENSLQQHDKRSNHRFSFSIFRGVLWSGVSNFMIWKCKHKKVIEDELFFLIPYLFFPRTFCARLGCPAVWDCGATVAKINR